MKIGQVVRPLTCKQTDVQTHTHAQTNLCENISPPLFRGGIIITVEHLQDITDCCFGIYCVTIEVITVKLTQKWFHKNRLKNTFFEK